MALGSSVQTVQQKNGKQMNDTEKGCVPLLSLSLSRFPPDLIPIVLVLHLVAHTHTHRRRHGYSRSIWFSSMHVCGGPLRKSQHSHKFGWPCLFRFCFIKVLPVEQITLLEFS